MVSPEESRELEVLLNQSRDGTHKQKVKEIADSHISIQEKLRQIRELDQKMIRMQQSERNLEDKHLRRLAKKSNILTPREAFDIQENLIRDNLRKPFLFFRIGDRGKLKQFQKRTGLLKVGLLPGSVKLDHSIRELIISFQNDARKAIPILLSIQKVAWAYLTKKDYNLIVAFQKMCEELLSIPANDIYLESGLILDETRQFCQNVLLCHYQSDYPRNILSSLNMVFVKYPKMEEKLQKARKSLQNLLNGVEHPQSLPNIVRAFFMSGLGRYFEVTDLMKTGYEEIVNTYDFESTEETKYKIRTFIDGKVNKLNSLSKVRGESQQIQKFLDQFLEKSDGKYDDRPLKNFYKDAGSEMGFNFVADSKNTSLFASNFFTLFLRNFWNLLIGEVQIEKVGKIHVFENKVFEVDFSQLKSLNSSYESSFYNQHDLPYERFIQLKRETAEGNPREMEIINLIDRMSNLLLNIGKKLANITKYRVSSGDVPPNKQIMVKEIKTRKVMIPYWDLQILSEGYLTRKTFGESVQNVVSICFLTALHFYNQEFLVLLSREKVMNHKMEEQFKSLERVCTIDECEMIRQKYHMDGE